MFNLNSWSKATASMPYCLIPRRLPKPCLDVASLKSPCLGLQKATFIYLAWPNGLGDPSDRL